MYVYNFFFKKHRNVFSFSISRVMSVFSRQDIWIWGTQCALYAVFLSCVNGIHVLFYNVEPVPSHVIPISLLNFGFKKSSSDNYICVKKWFFTIFTILHFTKLGLEIKNLNVIISRIRLFVVFTYLRNQ